MKSCGCNLQGWQKGNLVFTGFGILVHPVISLVHFTEARKTLQIG
jgi:hypothetical protein